MTKDNKGGRRIPELRFKGFTGDWEQRKLIEFVKRQSIQTDESAFPSVEYEDIISGAGILNKDITQKLRHKKGIIFAPGDILFGKLRPYLDNRLFPKFQGVAVGDFWVMRPVGLVAAFLYALIQSPLFRYVANQSSGTKMPRSDWSRVSNTEFRIPPIYGEQKKFGDFFIKLDNIIALHERKLELLKKLKRAYLQQIFPNNGSKSPQLRFAGLITDWEKYKLGSLLSYEQPGPFIVDHEKYDDSYGTPVLTAGKSLILGYTNETSGIKVASPDRPVIIFDDFTTSSHLIDYPFKVKSSAIKILSPLQSNVVFDFGILTRMQITPKSHERHWISQFANREVFVPNIYEQDKVAKIILQFDRIITLSDRKITELKSLKQAYLQKLFV